MAACRLLLLLQVPLTPALLHLGQARPADGAMTLLPFTCTYCFAGVLSNSVYVLDGMCGKWVPCAVPPVLERVSHAADPLMAGSRDGLA